MRLFFVIFLVTICVYCMYEILKDDLNAKKKLTQMLPEYAKNSEAFKKLSEKCSNIPREYVEMTNILTNSRIYNKSLLLLDAICKQFMPKPECLLDND